MGVAVMVLAVFLMTLKDSLAKLTGGNYSPLLILWVQFVFMSAVYFPYLIWRYGPEILLPKPFLPQVMRGLAIVFAVSLFYRAIETTPLADATATVFVAPLVVTAISPLFLSEHVGFRRWSAVIVGFFGVLLILRPDFDGGRQGYFMAFGTGLFLGLRESFPSRETAQRHASARLGGLFGLYRGDRSNAVCALHLDTAPTSGLFDHFLVSDYLYGGPNLPDDGV